MMLLVLFLVISLGFAQEVKVIDFKKAVEIAFENNREIQRIKREILSLEDIYRAEKWDRFSPKIDLFVDKDGLSVFGEVLLLDFGNRMARIRSAEINAQMKRELLQEFRRQVVIRIVRLFMDLALAEKLAEVRREEMAVAYVRWDKARNERGEGLLNREEEAKLETIYREKRMELLKAQYDYNRYLNKLVYFIGIDKKDFEILIPEIKVDINGEFKSDYVKREALTGNYDMKIGRMLMEYYESKRDGQRYAPYLFIDLGGGYSTRPFGSRYKWYGGIRLELPMYDGGFISARRNFYETKRMKVVDKLNFLRKKIEGEIESLYYRWELIRGCFEYAESIERHSEENLDLKRSEYELELAFDLGYAMSYRSYAELKRMECEHKLTLFLIDVYLLMGRDVFNVFKEGHAFIGEREVTF